MIYSKAKTTPAYWILFICTAISLSIFSMVFIENQRDLLLEHEKASLENEILMASEFIKEDLLKEDYNHIESFLELWASENKNIISVKVKAINGFILASHNRHSHSLKTIDISREIPGDIRMRLNVTYDLTEIDKHTDELAILLIVSNIIFLVMLMLLLWAILFYYLVKPLRASEEKFIAMASFDPLTKILNRRAFNDSSLRELNRCKRHNRSFTLLLLDLDHFKRVNDNFGHSVGDHILQLVTTEIKMVIRNTDILGRIGGEELAICMPELNLYSGRLTAERIRKKIEALPPLKKDDLSIKITVSIGACEANENDSLETLMNKSDKALYKCKDSGRNCVSVYDNTQMEQA